MKAVSTIAALALYGLGIGSPADAAWGSFSAWTASDEADSTAFCYATRSTGSRRIGLAYIFWVQSGTGDSYRHFAFAENKTGRGKGADLWVQMWHARSRVISAERQGFNIVPDQWIAIHLDEGQPTFLARCAVQ